MQKNLSCPLFISNRSRAAAISEAFGGAADRVRDFALMMKVNPNTMQRALAELENLGLVYTERTNGRFVTKDENIIEKYPYYTK